MKKVETRDVSINAYALKWSGKSFYDDEESNKKNEKEITYKRSLHTDTP